MINPSPAAGPGAKWVNVHQHQYCCFQLMSNVKIYLFCSHFTSHVCTIRCVNLNIQYIIKYLYCPHSLPPFVRYAGSRLREATRVHIGFVRQGLQVIFLSQSLQVLRCYHPSLYDWRYGHYACIFFKCLPVYDFWTLELKTLRSKITYQHTNTPSFVDWLDFLHQVDDSLGICIFSQCTHNG